MLFSLTYTEVPLQLRHGSFMEDLADKTHALVAVEFVARITIAHCYSSTLLTSKIEDKKK